MFEKTFKIKIIFALYFFITNCKYRILSTINLCARPQKFQK